VNPDGLPAQYWAGARVLVLSPTPTHPQDYGNRRRIFEICRRLTAEGARITFVHYAAEHEWRGDVPRGAGSAERAMALAWWQYHTIAPTRIVHANAIGHHHEIDEWWDPAIESFLTWLFKTRSFEVFVVNYSWLSKALEFAPPSLLKILDTHDKLSGRRDVLDSLGIRPEFFHTTEAEEKIALDRADLVWAIKDQERVAFQRMTATPVLTMSHMEPFNALPRPEPDPDGYLRVGIIGARNNVNLINITRFLKVAELVFRETFAPIKIVIAGSVCSLLSDLNYSFVELRGTVESVEDFYRSVDCVAIPIELSTGLKIKAAEAISFGVPVVSTAHAFEGLPVCGSLQNLADFTQLARALADLAFAPRTELEMAAAVSQSTHSHAIAEIEKTFRKTADLAVGHQHIIVLAVDSRAFVPDSVFNLVLTSTYERLRELATVVILVVAGSAEDVVANPSIVGRFERIVVGTEVAHAQHLYSKLDTMAVDVQPTGAFLQVNRPKAVIADALNSAMFLEHCPHTEIVTRPELIAFSEDSANFKAPVAAYRRTYAVAPAHSREMVARATATGIELPTEPYILRLSPNMFPHKYGSEKRVALLGSPWAPAMPVAVRMAQSWGMKPFVIFGVNENAPSKWGKVSCIRANAFASRILKGTEMPPKFAVDLCAGAPGLPLCREILERLRVPTLSVLQTGAHTAEDFDLLPLAASTYGDLWHAFRSFALEPDETHERNFASVWHELESRSDWTWLRRYSKQILEAGDVC
jgi:glycosyltransferase involved in cell wall biosynthesis